MEQFIAVMRWKADGRVAKYQDFATQEDALKHVELFSSRWSEAFVTVTPEQGDISDWVVANGALTYDPLPIPVPQPDRVAALEARIAALEARQPQNGRV